MKTRPLSVFDKIESVMLVNGRIEVIKRKYNEQKYDDVYKEYYIAKDDQIVFEKIVKGTPPKGPLQINWKYYNFK